MEYKVGDYVRLQNGMLLQVSKTVSKEDAQIMLATSSRNNKNYTFGINFGPSDWDIKRKANIKFK